MPFVDPDRIEQSDRVQAASFASSVGVIPVSSYHPQLRLFPLRLTFLLLSAASHLSHSGKQMIGMTPIGMNQWESSQSSVFQSERDVKQHSRGGRPALVGTASTVDDRS